MMPFALFRLRRRQR